MYTANYSNNNFDIFTFKFTTNFKFPRLATT